MADGKWIDDLRGDMPLGEAAHLVFTLRLGVVRDRLPLAVTEADADVEHVHQLRVGTRRAGAALRIFAELLPDDLQRRLRKTLRRLRRAAGAARDWDVFLLTLRARLTRADSKRCRGLDFLLGYAHGQRVLAQQQLAQAAEGRAERLPELLDELAGALADVPSGAGTLRDFAVPALTALLRDLDAATARELSAYEQLHQVRILGKRLRYAMEVFDSCFAAAFREEFYPAVEEMQDILGEANDSYVASQRLRELRLRLQRTEPALWPSYQPGLDALLRFHDRRLPQRRLAFEKWWQNWQRSGAEKALVKLIRSAH